MALDEAVLEASPPQALILRLYEWAAPACTFGYSQAFQSARSACDERGWKDVAPVRRATGGGVVFHDGDVTFSLVFPWNKTCAPETIYKNIHRGIHLALKAAGIASGLWTSTQREEGVRLHCFSLPEKMDVIGSDGKKILGGALRKKGIKGLYQGSLRAGVSGEIVREGVEREFGRPSLDLLADWLEAGRVLEDRYRSSRWDRRR